MNKPKVSIVCITYNQSKYIKDALDGFIKQKTNFDFEIIIADDCSTDDTAAIIKKYSAENPKLFRPIYRQKNIGVIPNLFDAMRQAKGDYIALCEGDDYWTDSNKLQSQVDFLDKHNDYALCFHPAQVISENNKTGPVYPEISGTHKFTIEELLKWNFIATNTVLYRKQKYNDLGNEDILPGDWFLHLYHARYGKIGYINKVMGVYRKHPESLWSDRNKNKSAFWQRFLLNHLNFYDRLIDMFGSDANKAAIITNNLASAYNEAIDSGSGSKLVPEVLVKNPQSGYLYIKKLRKIIEAQERTLKKEKESKIKLANEIKLQNKQLASELNAIKSSRTWRARGRIVKMLGH